jgi:hypothetical protein
LAADGTFEDTTGASDPKGVLQSFSLMLQVVLQSLLAVSQEVQGADGVDSTALAAIDSSTAVPPTSSRQNELPLMTCAYEANVLRHSLALILKVLHSLKLMKDADQASSSCS